MCHYGDSSIYRAFSLEIKGLKTFNSSVTITYKK